MKILLPCLLLAALGLIFGAVHMLAGKSAPDDGDEAANPFCAGANCGACGFKGCGFFAAGRAPETDGRTTDEDGAA